MKLHRILTPLLATAQPFREGVAVFKRNGLYYFMWSVDDANSDNNLVRLDFLSAFPYYKFSIA